MGKRQNLTVRVYGHILQQILQYQFVAGQRLIFVDLAKQFKVSRTPVHNALSILARQGYLDQIPNKGYTVHSFTLREIGELIEWKQTLEKGLMRQLRKASAKQLREILRCKMIFDTAAMDTLYRPLTSHDLDFHLAIAAVFDNGPAVELYRETLQKLTMAAVNPDVHRPALHIISKEHNDIFTAIRLKDTEHLVHLAVSHQPLILKREEPKTRKRTHHPLPQQLLHATVPN